MAYTSAGLPVSEKIKKMVRDFAVTDEGIKRTKKE
jgi:hypothetical protein